MTRGELEYICEDWTPEEVLRLLGEVQGGLEKWVGFRYRIFKIGLLIINRAITEAGEGGEERL